MLKELNTIVIHTEKCAFSRNNKLTFMYHIHGQQQPFYSPLTRTTWVIWYQKKHSPTHTYPDHQSYFISFFRLLWSMASSLFNLRAWQSFSTISVKVLLVCLLVWNPPLHTLYISSSSRCLLFAAFCRNLQKRALPPTCFPSFNFQSARSQGAGRLDHR